VKSYIIRVYRHDRNNPRRLVGTVEEPHLKGKKAFTNLDELWEIFNPAAEAKVARRRTEDPLRQKSRK
jgi:hypothetical protein